AMHVNQSISNTKKCKNLFFDNGELSSLAYYYIGGILKHAKALTAVTNPTVNSYKRLVPGYEAPVFITWGICDRSSLIRIPVANEKSKRIELRTPDASCNPYLAFAAMLAASLDGIKRKIDPGDEENGIEYYSNNAKIDDSKKLPRNLNEALRELSKDDVIKNALGEIAYKQLMLSCMFDWKEYSKEVSPWEFERYLNV
ncbi:MAG: type I glutamate--ammonia ligase, partial [Candidatus Methanofastidiosia archaeon]